MPGAKIACTGMRMGTSKLQINLMSACSGVQVCRKSGKLNPLSKLFAQPTKDA
jgi:hypothetical protein